MSQPVLKPDPSTGIFHVCWSFNRRSRRRSLKTADPALARALFARWLLLDHDAPAAPDMTIGECWAIYSAKHRPVSAVAMQRRWAALTGPFFGAMKVSDFGQAAVNRYVDQRTSGRLGGSAVQAHSTRKELSDVIAAMNHCAGARRFVVAKVKLPAAGEPRDRWLRDAEIKALFDAAGDRDLRLFLEIALNTAGRVQAILDLTWDRVDFQTGVIHLDVPNRAKTKKRRASVPISASLMPVLQDAYGMSAAPRPLPRLFYGVTAQAIWSKLNKAVVAAGIAPIVENGAKRPRATGIGPHVLRHTAATRMVRNGVPLAHVAAVLGNTVQVVQNSYAHHLPEHLRGAVDAISGGK